MSAGRVRTSVIVPTTKIHARDSTLLPPAQFSRNLSLPGLSKGVMRNIIKLKNKFYLASRVQRASFSASGNPLSQVGKNKNREISANE
jgi:hypothetical protein